jgi:hypothetical protein
MTTTSYVSSHFFGRASPAASACPAARGIPLAASPAIAAAPPAVFKKFRLLSVFSVASSLSIVFPPVVRFGHSLIEKQKLPKVKISEKKRRRLMKQAETRDVRIRQMIRSEHFNGLIHTPN